MIDVVAIQKADKSLVSHIDLAHIQPDDCWMWTGCKRNGYGTVVRQERTMLVHRYIWTLVVGPIGEGLCVCHSCDQPLCVNPNHHWLGTTEQNTADRHAKGRSASRERNGAYTKPGQVRKGMTNGRAKLTDDLVREIRRLYEEGEKPKTLAKMFEVSHQNIYFIVRRMTWPEVTAVPEPVQPGPVRRHRYAKSHCVRGHEFTEANTIPRPTGGRRCLACEADNSRRELERKHAIRLTQGRPTRLKYSLTPEQVREMRRLYDSRRYRQSDLVKMFEVNPNTVSAVVRRLSYQGVVD